MYLEESHARPSKYRPDGRNYSQRDSLDCVSLARPETC